MSLEEAVNSVPDTANLQARLWRALEALAAIERMLAAGQRDAAIAACEAALIDHDDSDLEDLIFNMIEDHPDRLRTPDVVNAIAPISQFRVREILSSYWLNGHVTLSGERYLSVNYDKPRMDAS